MFCRFSEFPISPEDVELCRRLEFEVTVAVKLEEAEAGVAVVDVAVVLCIDVGEGENVVEKKMWAAK